MIVNLFQLTYSMTSQISPTRDNMPQELIAAMYFAGCAYSVGLAYYISDKPESLATWLCLGYGLYDNKTSKDDWVFGIPLLYDLTLAKGRSRDEVFLTNIALLGLMMWIMPEEKNSEIKANNSGLQFYNGPDQTYLTWKTSF